ncbi:M14 family metallopeptidase [Pontibacillus litoralis]|uniref:M14 family metallopeptidase n=1 Tax=Pontibacillus litoralis TaxID=516703 RepID=UPI0005657D73|nr:M14 family metallocarboxypeptidase [Pontibacillus litoralis]
MYDFGALRTEIDELVTTFPNIHVQDIGHSILHKPIYELSIGKGARLIHWNGSFHANEWVTSLLLMKALRTVGRALTENEELLEHISLSVVPMVNPDGVDLVHHGSVAAGAYQSFVEEINNRHNHRTFTSWKANIRGVDLNNQFPAQWELEQRRKPKAPTFRDFPGYAPLSEPESIAMYQLMRRKKFHRVLAFHTQGNVIYWGYNGKEPASSLHTVHALASKSGYVPIQTVDSHGGYKDWIIHEYSSEGYTVEVGKGINPLPISTFPQLYKEVESICLESIQ